MIATGSILEKSLPYTFTNDASDYISITPIQIEPGMSFELSYVFSNEAIDANYDGNSHPVDPALLWIGGTDYSGDPPYYQIFRKNNGQYLDIRTRQDHTVENFSKKEAHYRNNILNLHLVWILHKNGMDSDLYVNGKKLSENTSRPIFIYDELELLSMEFRVILILVNQMRLI